MSTNNIKLKDILFPIETRRIFLQNERVPIPGKMAIIGDFNEKKNQFISIVSSSYEIFTNKQAYELGLKINKLLFPASSQNFEIFNIIAPTTRSYCMIDLLAKGNGFNVFGEEKYYPFIRIYNSYNGTYSLRFKIGFCRGICYNGNIFGDQSIQLEFIHSKSGIRKTLNPIVNFKEIRDLELKFSEWAQFANVLELPQNNFVPLAAKILNRNFKTSTKHTNKKASIEENKNKFINYINEKTEEYAKRQKLGFTGYALFNVMTDFIGNSNLVNTNAINGMQQNTTLWLQGLKTLVNKPNFSWDIEIKDHVYLLN